MATARVFKSGNSQAVRLPKEFRFQGKEVEIFRRGDEVVLREGGHAMARVLDIVANLDLDWDAIERLRKQPAQQRDFGDAFDPVPKRKPRPKRKKA
jgi:antitoxin VapB